MIKKLSLPVQLCLVIGIVCIFGGIMPFGLMRLFYTFSAVFKEILCFMLPFIIFSFVVNGILLLKKNAPLVLVVMIGAIFASNFCVALSMYGIMKWMEPFLVRSGQMHELVSNGSLEPFFSLQLPTLVKSEFALLSALIVGLFFSF